MFRTHPKFSFEFERPRRQEDLQIWNLERIQAGDVYLK